MSMPLYGVLSEAECPLCLYDDILYYFALGVEFMLSGLKIITTGVNGYEFYKITGTKSSYNL